MPEIIVIAHNIRSTHNVGSIFRTAEGFGVQKIILSGYTPSPSHPGDTRLPHLAAKITNQIHKTALGAEVMVPFERLAYQDTQPSNGVMSDAALLHELVELRADGYRIVALEQAKNSQPLNAYQAPPRLALLLGEEVHGIPAELLAECQDIVEIPMKGRKESFNVSVAAGIALYQLSLR